MTFKNFNFQSFKITTPLKSAIIGFMIFNLYQVFALSRLDNELKKAQNTLYSQPDQSATQLRLGLPQYLEVFLKERSYRKNGEFVIDTTSIETPPSNEAIDNVRNSNSTVYEDLLFQNNNKSNINKWYDLFFKLNNY